MIIRYQLRRSLRGAPRERVAQSAVAVHTLPSLSFLLQLQPTRSARYTETTRVPPANDSIVVTVLGVQRHNSGSAFDDLGLHQLGPSNETRPRLRTIVVKAPEAIFESCDRTVIPIN